LSFRKLPHSTPHLPLFLSSPQDSPRTPPNPCPVFSPSCPPRALPRSVPAPPLPGEAAARLLPHTTARPPARSPRQSQTTKQPCPLLHPASRCKPSSQRIPQPLVSDTSNTRLPPAKRKSRPATAAATFAVPKPPQGSRRQALPRPKARCSRSKPQLRQRHSQGLSISLFA